MQNYIVDGLFRVVGGTGRDKWLEKIMYVKKGFNYELHIQKNSTKRNICHILHGSAVDI